VLAAIASLLLCSEASAAAAHLLTADFDGDGRHDRVTLDQRDPSLLRVWLSTTDSTLLIHSGAPLVGIAATDLDGDHRAELIARSDSAALQVWTNTYTGFRRFRPRHTAQASSVVTHHHRIDDGPADETSELSSENSSLLALSLSPLPRAPAEVKRDPLRLTSASSAPVLPGAPFAPRPPPRLTSC
jgi:hypothetical protein